MKLIFTLALSVVLFACGNKNNTANNNTNNTTAASMAHLVGVYGADTPVEGSVEFEVESVDNNQLKFSIFCRSVDYSSGEPGENPDYDTKSLEGTVPIENNQAIWNGDEAANKCKLSFAFADNSVTLTGIGDCINNIVPVDKLVMTKMKQ